MLELGIAVLVLAILVRFVASVAKFAFGLLFIGGLILVVLGLLGVEPTGLLGGWLS